MNTDMVSTPLCAEAAPEGDVTLYWFEETVDATGFRPDWDQLCQQFAELMAQPASWDLIEPGLAEMQWGLLLNVSARTGDDPMKMLAAEQLLAQELSRLSKTEEHDDTTGAGEGVHDVGDSGPDTFSPQDGDKVGDSKSDPVVQDGRGALPIPPRRRGRPKKTVT